VIDELEALLACVNHHDTGLAVFDLTHPTAILTENTHGVVAFVGEFVAIAVFHAIWGGEFLGELPLVHPQNAYIIEEGMSQEAGHVP
jgi:hypothetical protein